VKRKYCPMCEEWLDTEQFTPRKSRAGYHKPGELMSYCRSCTTLRRRFYRRRKYKVVNGKYVWTGVYQ
jgi:RNase P subunit RPR2